MPSLPAAGPPRPIALKINGTPGVQLAVVTLFISPPQTMHGPDPNPDDEANDAPNNRAKDRHNRSRDGADDRSRAGRAKPHAE